MKTTQYLAEVVQELSRTVDLISDEEAEKLVNKILESKKNLCCRCGQIWIYGQIFRDENDAHGDRCLCSR